MTDEAAEEPRPHVAGLALSDATTPDRKRIVSWAMWDWGTQPFNSVITTFVFAVYITGSAFGPTNETSTALSISTAVAGLLIAALAPVLGQSADRSGHTVRNLRFLTWILALISASLFFVRPQPAYLWLGLGLLGVGSIVSEIAGVNYNSTIDQVASPHNVGRVSGFGWGMGYLGGIIVLLLLYFGLIAPEVGLFGVTSADAMDIRVSMIICGVWTMLFTIPTFLLLRDRPPSGERIATSLGASYRELWRTIAKLWHSDRTTVYFLMASALFRDGLAGVFAFGAVIAAGTFGFSAGDVVVFGAVANIVAGVATMAFGLLDDKIGPRAVILVSLASLTFLGIGIFFLHSGGRPVFWTLGLAMTVFVGPAQSASRTFLARLIPEGKSGEIFGLYATTGRVVSFLSPAAFGLMIALGAAVTGQENTQYWGILGIVVVIAAGFVVMLRVRPTGPGTAAGNDLEAPSVTR